MDYYTRFNLYESIFWIISGITCYLAGKYLPVKYRKISVIALYIFVLFGISDLVEIKTQGFLYPLVLWLLIWKVLGVISMLTIIIWYFRLRLNK